MKSRIRHTARDTRTHGSSLVVLLVAVGLSLLAFTVLVNAAASNTTPTAATGSSSGAGQLGPEILEKRTRNSKTFAGPEGRGVVTRVYAGPVHFKGANGDWLEIRSDLERASGGGLRNGRNHYGLELPDQLGSAPVKIGEGGDELSFSLAGAQGTAVAKHNEATFADALPGVTVKYAALSNAVKEDLVLSGPDSPTTFTFRVGSSAGLTATKSRDGGIEFRNAAGDVAFALPAPFMFDAAHKPQASGAVSYDIERRADGWQLTLRADRGWLGAKDREWPVTVDPTVNFGSNRDCTLDQGNPTSDWCAQTTVRAGICGGVKNNAILNFGIAGQLPKDAVVLSARMFAWESIGTHGVAKPIGVYRMTSAWQNGATWNTKDGVNPWTTAGGDFAAGPEAETTAGTANGTADVQRDWYITKLVQDWVDGSKPDYGVMLKDSAASPVDNVVYFRSSESWASARPYVEVYWEPRVGEGLSYTQNGESLNDRSSYKVNVATGNLELVSNDINIAGRGLDLPLSRYYNSGWANTYGGQFGGGQTADVGKDVWLAATGSPDNALLVYPGTGSAYPFFRKPGLWEWDQPAKLGLNADLKWITTPDTVELTYRGSDLKYVWGYTPYGRRQLLKIRDRNSNENTFAYDANGNMTSMSTSQGKTLTVSSNANGYITRVQDPTGRQWNYEYGINSEWNLVKKYTDPNGKQTLYDWDGPNQLLLKVTTPGGRQTNFAYHPDRKLKSVTRVDNITAQTGPTTNYAYYVGGSPCTSTQNRTVVTDPRGKPTTYCSDATNDRVMSVRDAKNHDQSSMYTTFGNVQQLTRPGSPTNSISSLNWDSTTNNLTGGTSPTGGAFDYTYNKGVTGQDFQPHDYINAQGGGARFGYDSKGNVTGVTATKQDPATPTNRKSRLLAAEKATLTYDTNGNIATATDGRGSAWTYSYDPAGNLIKVMPPNTGAVPGIPQLGDTVLTYDSLSRIATIRDGKGQTRTFTYDNLDRVTRVALSDGSNTSAVYDDDGNMTTRTDIAGATTNTTMIEYDGLNRMKKETLPGTKTNEYAYDASSNLSSLTTNANDTVSYQYDDVNLVAKVVEPPPTVGGVSPETTFDYDTRNNRTLTRYPNGIDVTQDFFGDDAVKLIEAKFGTTVRRRFEYTYVKGSQQTDLRQTVKREDGNTTTYDYDHLDRLLSATTNTSGGALVDKLSYDYDLASNRNKETKQVGTSAATSTGYGYNAANQLCWLAAGANPGACGTPPAGATKFTYDTNGNTLSGNRSYAYNINDQTTTIAGTALSYLGLSQNELVGIGGDNYQNNGLGVGLLKLGTGETFFFRRDPSGQLLSRKKLSDGSRHYYVADALGSVSMMTDTAGSSANLYEYEPYGSVKSQNIPLTNPFKFAGGHETGLGVYHFGARQYDPALGRWTQLDPLDQIGDLTEANRYGYVGGNPINLIDLAGEASCSTVGAGGTPASTCSGTGATYSGAGGRRPCAYQRGGCQAGINFKKAADWACYVKNVKDLVKRPAGKIGVAGAVVCAGWSGGRLAGLF